MSITRNSRKYILFLCIFAVGFLCSCVSDHRDLDIANSIGEKLKLKEVPLLDSSFYLSVPENYRVQETNGEDFSVYYFAPIDSTIKPKCIGGIYFGNHPSFSDIQMDSCTINKLSGEILGKNVKWNVRICSGEHHIELITDSESGENWNKYIHAFGRANSDQDLVQLLDIFSTLNKSE